MRQLAILALTLVAVSSIKFVEQFSKSAISVLHGSRLENDTIRMCTCTEMKDCFESSKLQAIECFDPCFMEISKFNLVDDPTSLKECFYEKKGFVTNLIHCFEENIKACTQDRSDAKMVPSADLKDLIDRVELQVQEQAQTFLKTVHSPEIQKVADAAKAVGHCVKKCFVEEKNKDGFCFDKLGCMPFISDRNARRSIRQCSRSINWKHEVSDLCTCSADAGVGGLSNYCGMLNVMGKK